MSAAAKPLSTLLPRLLLRHRVDEPLFIFCRALAAATLLQIPVVPAEALLLSALLPWHAAQTQYRRKSTLGSMAGFALLAAEVWLLMGCLPQVYLPHLFLPMLLLGTLYFQQKASPLLRSIFHAVMLAQCSLAPAYGFSFLYSPIEQFACNPAALSAVLLFLPLPVQQRFSHRPALPRFALLLSLLLLPCLCLAEAYFAFPFERPLFLLILAESLVILTTALLRRYLPRTALLSTSYLPLILVELAAIFC